MKRFWQSFTMYKPFNLVWNKHFNIIVKSMCLYILINIFYFGISKTKTTAQCYAYEVPVSYLLLIRAIRFCEQGLVSGHFIRDVQCRWSQSKAMLGTFLCYLWNIGNAADGDVGIFICWRSLSKNRFFPTSYFEAILKTQVLTKCSVFRVKKRKYGCHWGNGVFNKKALPFFLIELNDFLEVPFPKVIK